MGREAFLQKGFGDHDRECRRKVRSREQIKAWT